MKKFLVRSICFEVSSRPSAEFALRVEIGTSNTAYPRSEPSVSGLSA